MDSSSRHHVQWEGEEDYLSNLPDELLHHILSFLPTLDSIRTSVLGRRWRHVWTSVPVVDFPFLQLKPFIMKRFFDSRSCESVSLVRLSRLSKESETLVYDLIEYAKSTDVRHVTLLNFCLGHCSNSLFDLLFDWPSLVSLNLKVVCFKNCTFSKCRLSNLKTLSLKLPENTNRNESLANLLSGCPVLEELTLDAKNLFDNELFRIESPNLLRLALIPTPSNFQINCQKLEYLRLNPVFNFMYLRVEAPSLTSVRLCNIWRFRTFAPTVCDVTAVAITLSDKCHSLSGSTPKFLGKYKAVVQGFPIFYNLLELKIKMYVTDKLSLDIVLDLLRCAPNLQSLGLTAYNKRRRCDEDFDEWEKNSSSRINEPLKHLERVSVNIKSERIRSAFLKTLSDRVPAWDRVTVAY